MDLLSPHSDFYSILADWRAQEETDEETAPEENMSDSEDEYHW